MTSESMPCYSFEEENDTVLFVLVIDELDVQRKIGKLFKKVPVNITIRDKEISQQSFNLAIKINDSRKVYRFQIKRLPTKINVEKSKIEFDKGKIIVTLVKTEDETWKQFSDSDFETYHLVKK
ncbi:hypothetical protein BpHYR1_004455 [Brachionus plicatilis]|uniref:CS domain-containing protein n=1 Tax=Brachionus plicatilis TaxID=10195 RepID=A0A3M7S9W0_BRAPC|nr:hypothetical protein BpHYR1_004455 [Brachionus plicatilis]